MLEFWPDYGPGPLWTEGGAPVDLGSLGMDRGLVQRVEAWNAAYKEDKMPLEGPGDAGWLGEGRRLLEDVRTALGQEYQVVVTEPWWVE
jgi:hypothetical protein